MRMKVISTLQKATESLQKKDHQGGDRFHEQWTQAAFPAEIDENRAKRDAASKKQAAQRERPPLRSSTRILMRAPSRG